jgi:hypothetical protein
MAWSPEMERELYDFLTRDRDRERIADQRHAELVRAHRDGWEKVARALTGGLGQIADAIRSR